MAEETKIVDIIENDYAVIYPTKVERNAATVSRANAISRVLLEDVEDATLFDIIDDDITELQFQVIADASIAAHGVARFKVQTSNHKFSLVDFIETTKKGIYAPMFLHFEVHYRRILNDSKKRKAVDELPASSPAPSTAKKMKKELPPDYGRLIRDYEWKTFTAKKSLRPKTFSDFLAVVGVPLEEFGKLWTEAQKKTGRKPNWYSIVSQEYGEEIMDALGVVIDDDDDEE